MHEHQLERSACVTTCAGGSARGAADKRECRTALELAWLVGDMLIASGRILFVGRGFVDPGQQLQTTHVPFFRVVVSFRPSYSKTEERQQAGTCALMKLGRRERRFEPRGAIQDAVKIAMIDSPCGYALPVLLNAQAWQNWITRRILTQRPQ